MRIAIASDHAAIELKSELVSWLTDLGHEIQILAQLLVGVDYPDWLQAASTVKTVSSKRHSLMRQRHWNFY